MSGDKEVEELWIQFRDISYHQRDLKIIQLIAKERAEIEEQYATLLKRHVNKVNKLRQRISGTDVNVAAAIAVIADCCQREAECRDKLRTTLDSSGDPSDCDGVVQEIEDFCNTMSKSNLKRRVMRIANRGHRTKRDVREAGDLCMTSENKANFKRKVLMIANYRSDCHCTSNDGKQMCEITITNNDMKPAESDEGTTEDFSGSDTEALLMGGDTAQVKRKSSLKDVITCQKLNEKKKDFLTLVMTAMGPPEQPAHAMHQLEKEIVTKSFQSGNMVNEMLKIILHGAYDCSKTTHQEMRRKVPDVSWRLLNATTVVAAMNARFIKESSSEESPDSSRDEHRDCTPISNSAESRDLIVVRAPQTSVDYENDFHGDEECKLSREMLLFKIKVPPKQYGLQNGNK